MRFLNRTLLSAGDMSADVTTPAQNLELLSSYSIQAIFTGGPPTGTFKLQASNDAGVVRNDGTVSGVSSWTDIDGSSQAVSAAGDVLWDVDTPGYRWVRLVYTRSAGSGMLAVTINAKGW